MINKNKAFTLVELLIVLSIMGVLLSVVLASTTLARAKSRDTKRISDMKEIQLGLAVYFDVNRVYPASLNTLTSQGFLPSLPTDPQGTAYEYLSSSPNSTYCLGSKLENTIPTDNTSCTSAASGSTANYKVIPPQN